ncbi:MAG: DUF2232 domain-containing protein [Bdellovibrionales bacterium]|nr:DUF2232 domain-containing protein [Oligoflexia bacterium]
MNDSKPIIETKTPGAAVRMITQVAPFLLPVFFFKMAVLAFISPLPLFILTLRNPIWMSGLALACNVAILYLTGTQTEAGVATFCWLSVGVLFPYLIRRSGKIRLSFAFSYIYLIGVLVLTFAFLANRAGMGIIEYIRADISMGIDRLVAIPNSPVKTLVEEQGRDGLFKQLMTELPSGVMIATLIGFWINLLFASQFVQGFLSPQFWSEYRNPEWLIWPTLGCGALFAFTEHAPYYIGLNGFKFLLVFYGFQGLSVISFLLTRYKILGFGRALLFSMAIFLAMPLVLSLGFFDLWFDFRRKFGQS